MEYAVQETLDCWFLPVDKILLQIYLIVFIDPMAFKIKFKNILHKYQTKMLYFHYQVPFKASLCAKSYC